MNQENREASPRKDSFRLKIPILFRLGSIFLCLLMLYGVARLILGFSTILFKAWAEINDPNSLVNFSPWFAIVTILPLLIFFSLSFLYLIYLLITQGIGKGTKDNSDMEINPS